MEFKLTNEENVSLCVLIEKTTPGRREINLYIEDPIYGLMGNIILEPEELSDFIGTLLHVQAKLKRGI